MTALAKLSSQFATDLQVSFGSNFEAKSDEKTVLDGHRVRNSSWVRLSLDFPLLGVLLGPLGWLWATLGPPLGDLGGSRRCLWDALELPRDSPGVPGEPPGTLWAPFWAPLGLQAWIWEGFVFQNHQK